MSSSDADVFAEGWVAAFNSHDLARIVSHYDPDIELSSPVYFKFTEGRTARLKGIGELESYFRGGLQRFPNLRFTLLETYKGFESVCVRYHTTVGDRVACEVMEFAPDGAVRRVAAHYA